MIARIKWYLDPSSHHQLKKVVPSSTKKDCQSWTPLTKLSGSAHDDCGLNVVQSLLVNIKCVVMKDLFAWMMLLS